MSSANISATSRKYFPLFMAQAGQQATLPSDCVLFFYLRGTLAQRSDTILFRATCPLPIVTKYNM